MRGTEPVRSGVKPAIKAGLLLPTNAECTSDLATESECTPDGLYHRSGGDSTPQGLCPRSSDVAKVLRQSFVDAPVATSTADPIRAHFFSQRDARRRIGVYVVLSGLLVGFLFTSSIAWVALTAAGVLAIAEAYLQPRSRDPTVILGYVDGPLLVMIGGLTGLPQEIFDLAKSIKGVGLDFDSPKDVCVFAILVLVLSNICSNVPTVMLLSGQMMKLDPSIVGPRYAFGT